MSRSGSRPDSSIIARASSMIRTGSPMSSTNTSAPPRRDRRADLPRRGRRRERAGADDQLDGLGDRHEVARHALVGDRHRAAALDLAAEDRHDAAGGAEHVAEAHGRVARLREARGGRVERELGERLGGAHHGRRRDRLVGRDEHEAADAELAGDVRDDARGDRVVAHRLDRVGLHQPDVLVGGGVEDDRRAVLGEAPRASAPPPCSRRAPPRASTGGTWRSSSSSRWIENRLSSAWSSSTIRCGSTRAIWRHSSEPIEPPAPVTSTVSPAEVGADALELHLHRLAAEHVLDAHLAHLARERAARLQQLEHGRQRAHGDAALAALAHDRARASSRAPRGSR